MKTIEPIDRKTAGELIDFSGRDAIGGGMPEVQLDGTVAIHNILAREGFAYLADEVGMGKTYVALGVVGLLRFFQPTVRVLFIAPRENIQRKWIKELRNFTANNWRHRDQRVRSLEDRPPHPPVFAGSLIDWAKKAVRDPHRDVFLRMSSFSFGLPEKKAAWSAKRDELLALAPRIPPGDISLKHADKRRFKLDYASALNTILPRYDLLIIDEAHCLKHGRKTAAARNQLLAHTLGTADGRGLTPRFDRVLLLSATPLESDFVQLWNQLDILAHGDSIAALSEPGDEEAKRNVARRFLVRRLTQLRIAGEPYTKNMYRQEWRRGGVIAHGDPLEIPSDRQRLMVALIQKKVSEVLNDPVFGARFQMGMLSSFESFMETAKVSVETPDDEEGEREVSFHVSDQTDDALEKQGIDSAAVNQIARSYKKKFREPMPHPKMDAVVDSISSGFETGDKALVFVRRVRTVAEMGEKLLRKYDAALHTRLSHDFADHPLLLEQLENQWTTYEEERLSRRRRAETRTRGPGLREDEEQDESGGNESFFAWFFRGDGPPGVLSGAAFKKNRLRGEASAYSTFFEDNYVWDLLGFPDDTLSSLATTLGRDKETVAEELERLAASRVYQSKRKKQPRLRIYRAYQEAALHLLAQPGSPLAKKASVVLQLRFARGELRPYQGSNELPPAASYLATRTFFTELRSRTELRRVLWPSPNDTEQDFRAYFRERDTRRALLSAVARLGHSFIDLWVLAVRRLGTMSLRAQERAEGRAEQLMSDFLDRLEAQRDSGTKTFDAHRELAHIGENHPLLMTVNFADEKEAPLDRLATLFGRALAQQTPVGGMHGGVTSRVVTQFRMPGYPFALITTDVLQEGEDLHTFCSRIVHYGISWTPSAMEQRTGRVDRIGSLAHRRLEGLPGPPSTAELLQVQYPYLADTVEKLQVDRVFRRMNRFVELTHHGFAADSESASIDTKRGMLEVVPTVPADVVLESAFPVRKEHQRGTRRDTAAPSERVGRILEHFTELSKALATRLRLEWDGDQPRTARYGTVYVADDGLQRPSDSQEDARQQPFFLQLRSSRTSEHIIVHAVSPVGFDGRDDDRASRLVDLQTAIPLRLRSARICERPSGERSRYLISVESDMHFHHESAHVEELVDLVSRVTVVADRVEENLFAEQDAPIDQFRANLRRSAQHE